MIAPEKACSVPARARLTSWDWVVAIIATLVVTLVSIQYSAQHGRLSKDVSYDDCVYFADAAERLTILRNDGVRAFIRHYKAMPPHAPVSTMQALTGFALFGFVDWAPYALNAVPLFCFILFLLYLARSLPPWQRALIAGFGCTIPFSNLAIMIFRPEFPAGLFVSMAIVLVLENSLRETTGKKFLASGIFAGLALISKPTFFPLTLFVYGCALGLALLMAWGKPWRIPVHERKEAWTSLLLPIGAMLLVALPHYLYGAANTIGYILRNQLGETSSLWKYKGDWSEQFAYFLTGWPGKLMLGKHLGLFLGLIMIGITISLFKKDARWRQYIAAVSAVAVVFYLFVSLNTHKQFIFGWGFQTLLTFIAVSALVYILHAVKIQPSARFGPAIGTLLAVFVFIFGVRHLRAEWQGWVGDEQYEAHARVSTHLIQFLKGQPAAGQAPKTLYVSCAQGVLNSDTLKWVAYRESIQNKFVFTSGSFVSDLEAHKSASNAADYVVISQQGVTDGTDWLPATKIADGLIEWMQSNPSFRMIKTFPTLSGKSHWVFAKIGTANASHEVNEGSTTAVPDLMKYSHRGTSFAFKTSHPLCRK